MNEISKKTFKKYNKMAYMKEDGEKMVKGYTVEKNQSWPLAMKKQDCKCARCKSLLANNIKKAQKERWIVEGVGYCGTCSVIIKRGMKNDL